MNLSFFKEHQQLGDRIKAEISTARGGMVKISPFMTLMWNEGSSGVTQLVAFQLFGG